MDWTLRRVTGAAPLLAAMLVTGCSGTSPTASPTTIEPAPNEATPAQIAEIAQGSTLVFLSAESGAPVAGVEVLVGEPPARYRTDGAGQIRLSDNVTLPATVEASSSEYLLRQTLLRAGDGHTLTLWPRFSPTGLDEEITRRIVYTEAAGGPVGARALHRIAAGRVSIVPSAAILVDPVAMEAHHAAAAALTDATRGAVQFVVEASPGPGVLVRTGVDGKDPAMHGHAALTYRTIESGRITAARIVFLSHGIARLPGIVAHELGHSFGLEHSQDQQDLMYPVVESEKRLSLRESVVVDLMLKRRPGNRFPDNDRDSGAALGRRVEVVACR
jgi:hypothetical protein